MKEKKIKNNKKVVLYLVLIICLLTTTTITFAYYTNVHSFFEESIKDDGYSGLAQERNETDFIEDGCGTDTMLDVVTGLCWQKNMSTAGQMNWTDAKSYCDNLELEENSDWYLPTNNELMTLIDEIGGTDSTKTTLESFSFLNVQSNYYWSSEECKWSTGSAWGVYFNGGLGASFDKTNTYYVACVRRNS